MPDLFRPLPSTSRRDRARAALAGVGPARLATAIGTLVAVAVAAWWLLRTPALPVEARLPRAAASGSARSTTTGARPPGSTAGRATTVVANGSTGAGPASAVSPAESPASAHPEPSATSGAPVTTIVVQVAGKVARPGVYHLPADARVVDLVEAAGGVIADGDAGGVALAARLADGQRVVVPAVGEHVPAGGNGASSPSGGVGAGPAAGSGAAGSGGAPTAEDPVDLNTATLADLDRLPGVGPATAAAIVAYRDAHGPFRTVDDLGEVRGIGPARLEALRALVRA